jgi:hypothetical protein
MLISFFYVVHTAVMLQDSDDLEEFALYGALAATIFYRRKQRLHAKQHERAKKRFWVRSWLLRRPLYGQYEQLMSELAREDIEGFKNFQRVDPDLFQELLAKVGPHIQRQSTNMRIPLEPGIRLAITLRYLATGNSYKSLEYGFRVANNTISSIVPETCQALYDVLADEFLKVRNYFLLLY